LPDYDLSKLLLWCKVASTATHVPIPPSYPLAGEDAFRTATGVHAAAIIKAEQKGDAWLADRIYSSVPASMVGSQQVIEIGPMSGLSNVKYWLKTHGRDPDDDVLSGRIFEAAKHTDHTLTREELEALCRGG